jgi:threonine dehydrogenase-like Zn-dependent dehydrogenase
VKAIAVVPQKADVRLVDRPEPMITAPDQVKMRMLRVGICGTDREEIKGRAGVPAGQTDLVIGHENFGVVVDVGDAVTKLHPGNLAAFTVRRGCGQCLPCMMNRSDMCRTGQYRERGIRGQDGYQAEYAVDSEQYAVAIPAALEPVGVLSEPLSVVEKTIDVAVSIQMARLPDAQATPDWLLNRRCLIAGLGPIGLLAALALRLRGADVYGTDIVDETSARPAWLKRIGGTYIDGRQVPLEKLAGSVGPADIAIEATGAPGVAFKLVSCLGNDGIMAVVGVPGQAPMLQISGSDLWRRMVLGNLVIFGTVNAARDHFEMAVSDLENATRIWGDHVSHLITHHFPFADFAQALSEHPADEIKTVIEWSKP